MPANSVLIDDPLLVAQLTGVDVLGRSRVRIHTTTYWYCRACRAAILGTSGQLSGPFEGLDSTEQERAIAAMLQLPDRIGLFDHDPSCRSWSTSPVVTPNST